MNNRVLKCEVQNVQKEDAIRAELFCLGGRFGSGQETADKHSIADQIRQIVRLEADIFPDPWSERAVTETCMQRQTAVFVLKDDKEKDPQKQILGYLILYFVLDEAEIVRIAVSRECRRCKGGTKLLDRLKQFSREQNISLWHLDVRKSNEAAVCFYQNYGFAQDGLRKQFYDNPKEDAILFSKQL